MLTRQSSDNRSLTDFIQNSLEFVSNHFPNVSDINMGGSLLSPSSLRSEVFFPGTRQSGLTTSHIMAALRYTAVLKPCIQVFDADVVRDFTQNSERSSQMLGQLSLPIDTTKSPILIFPCPIHRKSSIHWTLGIADFTESRLLYFDSSNSTVNRELMLVKFRIFLQELGLDDTELKDDIAIGPGPQQLEASDSGFHLIRNASCYSDNRASARLIDSLRLRAWVLTFLVGGLIANEPIAADLDFDSSTTRGHSTALSVTRVGTEVAKAQDRLEMLRSQRQSHCHLMDVNTIQPSPMFVDLPLPTATPSDQIMHQSIVDTIGGYSEDHTDEMSIVVDNQSIASKHRPHHSRLKKAPDRAYGLPGSNGGVSSTDPCPPASRLESTKFNEKLGVVSTEEQTFREKSNTSPSVTSNEEDEEPDIEAEEVMGQELEEREELADDWNRESGKGKTHKNQQRKQNKRPETHDSQHGELFGMDSDNSEIGVSDLEGMSVTDSSNGKTSDLIEAGSVENNDMLQPQQYAGNALQRKRSNSPTKTKREKRLRANIVSLQASETSGPIGTTLYHLAATVASEEALNMLQQILTAVSSGRLNISKDAWGHDAKTLYNALQYADISQKLQCLVRRVASARLAQGYHATVANNGQWSFFTPENPPVASRIAKRLTFKGMILEIWDLGEPEHPKFTKHGLIEGTSPEIKAWNRHKKSLTNRLSVGTRWLEMGKLFGWSCFFLIAPDWRVSSERWASDTW